MNDKINQKLFKNCAAKESLFFPVPIVYLFALHPGNDKRQKP
jgi:hypothetical protein